MTNDECPMMRGSLFGIFLSLVICPWSFLPCSAAEAVPRPEVILATGAPGTDEYGAKFTEWADEWAKAATQGGALLTRIGAAASDTNSLAQLESTITSAHPLGGEPLWIVLIGHGTFDGREAKFNLAGDDISAERLAVLLAPVKRPVVIVAAFSSSGAFLKPLSAPGRVVLTATKSGSEVNYSRFGGFLAAALGSTAADRDKDGQVSLLEAWLSAARATADFYESEGRLATEHSLLDDNGDGAGTPPDWFSGVRLVKRADKGEGDGRLAHRIHLVPNPSDSALTPVQRETRDRLEREIEQLRQLKATLPPGDYWQRLEEKLLQLGKLYFVPPRED